MTHTYVMERLNRWVVFCLWRDDMLMRPPGPARAKSWWPLLVSALQRTPTSSEPPIVGVRSRCPVDEIEAGATDLCIDQLPYHLREAIVMSYLSTGTGDEKAEAIGCCRATLYNRLDAAYTELLSLMNDYEVGIARSAASPIQAPPRAA